MVVTQIILSLLYNNDASKLKYNGLCIIPASMAKTLMQTRKPLEMNTLTSTSLIERDHFQLSFVLLDPPQRELRSTPV